MPTITLTKPITHEGRTWTELDVDEPTVGAIEAFETAKADGKTDLTAMVEMLAYDLDMPADAVRRLRSTDLARVSEVLGPLADVLGADVLGAAGGGTGAPTSPTAPTS